MSIYFIMYLKVILSVIVFIQITCCTARRRHQDEESGEFSEVFKSNRQIELIRARICDNNTVDGQTMLSFEMIDKLMVCDKPLRPGFKLSNGSDVDSLCNNQVFGNDRMMMQDKFVTGFCDFHQRDMNNRNLMKVARCARKLMHSEKRSDEEKPDPKARLDNNNKAIGCFKSALRIDPNAEVEKQFAAEYLRTKFHLTKKLLCNARQVCGMKSKDNPKLKELRTAFSKCYADQPTVTDQSSTVKIELLTNPDTLCRFVKGHEMFKANYWTRNRKYGSITKQQFYEQHSHEIEGLINCQQQAMVAIDGDVEKKISRCISRRGGMN